MLLLNFLDINNHNDGDNIDKESELQQDSMVSLTVKCC